MNNNQFGRSMIEMLGVLAIIGVLSVGAIAGYQKAMLKYKLNKQTEQISSILDYIHIHLDDLKKSKASTDNLMDLLKNMNIIPKEMIDPSSTYHIYDVFHTLIRIGYVDTNVLEFIVYLNNGQKDACLNLFQIAKARSSMLWRTKFEYTKGNTSSGTNFVYGDKYCTASNKCLATFPLSEAEEFCNVCEDEEKDTCRFQLQWML